MTELNDNLNDRSQNVPDDFERPLTTAADVESAGRSCTVIIGLAIVIIVLIIIWVLYTST
jgi:hypothetical protein